MKTLSIDEKDLIVPVNEVVENLDNQESSKNLSKNSSRQKNYDFDSNELKSNLENLEYKQKIEKDIKPNLNISVNSNSNQLMNNNFN